VGKAKPTVKNKMAKDAKATITEINDIKAPNLSFLKPSISSET